MTNRDQFDRFFARVTLWNRIHPDKTGQPAQQSAPHNAAPTLDAPVRRSAESLDNPNRMAARKAH
jgi:hypothetical protein